MASYADRMQAAAKSMKKEKVEKGAYRPRAWVGGEGSVENEIVCAKLVTLRQLLALGCDHDKLRAWVDFSRVDADFAEIIVDEFGFDCGVEKKPAATKPTTKADDKKAALLAMLADLLA